MDNTDGLFASPANALRAGLRSSSYGLKPPFPDPDYWKNATTSMASRFDGAVPAVVWILGKMDGSSGECQLNFPSLGGTYPNVAFSSTDKNEAYLDVFDQVGAKVWLQVEPGATAVSTLIDLVLGRYASHPSVIGFGIDVEWYKYSADSNPEGVAVTDAEAQTWSEQVRTYNQDYSIFFKHWLTSKMPPTYRTGVMFLDDSQQFPSMASMVNEFNVWGQTFAPAAVGFQFGYPADGSWWRALSDPPRDIGKELLNRIPNTTDLFWVDFTMEEIWPR